MMQSTETKSSASSRMPYIDALRGFACLWVIAVHCIGIMRFGFGPNRSLLQNLIIAVAAKGMLGVDLFLVLSGFCLFYPLARKQELGQISFRLRDFFVRRARRILPAYYASIVVLAVIANLSFLHKQGFYDSSFELPNLAAHLFMVHNFSSTWAESINGAYWSLALEFQLYVCFPLLVFLLNRTNRWWLLVGLAAMSLAWETGVYQIVGDSGWAEGVVTYRAVPGVLFSFAGGMVAAYSVAKGHPIDRKLGMILGAVFIVGVTAGCFIPIYGIGHSVTWGAAWSALLVLAAQIPSERFHTNLPARAITGAGAFSYSIYLIHQPIVNFYMRSTARGGLLSHPNIALLGLPVVLIPTILVASYVFYLLFEKPFMGSSKKKKPTAVPIPKDPALAVESE